VLATPGSGGTPGSDVVVELVVVELVVVELVVVEPGAAGVGVHASAITATDPTNAAVRAVRPVNTFDPINPPVPWAEE
jgi:hypothetical protein